MPALRIGDDSSAMDAVAGSRPAYTLAEQIVLLAVDPRRGRLVERPPGSLAYAVAGAILAVLVGGGHLTVVDGQVKAGPDSGEPLTDTVLGQVRALSSAQSLGYWVNYLARSPFAALERTVAILTSRRVLAVEERRILGVHTVTRYRVVMNDARLTAVATLRDALKAPGDLDAAQASLITLASSCGLIGRVVDRSLRSAARRRLRDAAQQTRELTEALAEQGGIVGLPPGN